MSPDDALMMSYLLLVGKSVHAPGHLSGGSHSEWNAEANGLIGPHFEERNGSSRFVRQLLNSSISQHVSLSLSVCQSTS